MAVEIEHARTFPVGVERAYDVVLPTPLPTLFARRYAAMPPIREVRDQRGPWGTLGQTRTIVLADRGTMRETLTSAQRPRSFGYRLTDFTGAMSLFVAEVEGEWRFTSAGTGTQVTWAWTVHPRGVPGRLMMPGFERMWQGYARQAFELLEPLLVG